MMRSEDKCVSPTGLPGPAPNQRVSVRIASDKRDDVLKVERGAFVDSAAVAYRVQGTVLTRQPVTLGGMNEREVVILSGLNPEDRIVVSSVEMFGYVSQVRLANQESLSMPIDPARADHPAPSAPAALPRRLVCRDRFPAASS